MPQAGHPRRAHHHRGRRLCRPSPPGARGHPGRLPGRNDDILYELTDNGRINVFDGAYHYVNNEHVNGLDAGAAIDQFLDALDFATIQRAWDRKSATLRPVKLPAPDDEPDVQRPASGDSDQLRRLLTAAQLYSVKFDGLDAHDLIDIIRAAIDGQ